MKPNIGTKVKTSNQAQVADVSRLSKKTVTAAKNTFKISKITNR